MIESRYWREELRCVAAELRPVRHPKRWSERRLCVLERDLMVGFFVIRRLIELRKVTGRTRNLGMTAFAAPAKRALITELNKVDIYGVYDFSREAPAVRSPLFIANQFIHATTSVLCRGADRNWQDVLIASDRERNQQIWRVPIETIRSLFLTAAKDYPSALRYTWDKDRQDYAVAVT